MDFQQPTDMWYLLKGSKIQNTTIYGLVANANLNLEWSSW